MRTPTGVVREPFVEVSWETAERLVAQELTRVCTEYGNESIYGGSYGWASAISSCEYVHRFLNAIGGYTRSVNTYSLAAAEVILPRARWHHRLHLLSHAVANNRSTHRPNGCLGDCRSRTGIKVELAVISEP